MLAQTSADEYPKSASLAQGTRLAETMHQVPKICKRMFHHALTTYE
jgi:hypothetical protein